MKLNFAKIAASLAVAAVNAQTVVTFVETVIDLVQDVEDIADDLRGADKLEAVKAGAKTVALQLGILDDFERIWRKLGPIVSMIVKLFNLHGWPKKQPTPSLASMTPVPLTPTPTANGLKPA